MGSEVKPIHEIIIRRLDYAWISVVDVALLYLDGAAIPVDVSEKMINVLRDNKANLISSMACIETKAGSDEDIEKGSKAIHFLVELAIEAIRKQHKEKEEE